MQLQQKKDISKKKNGTPKKRHPNKKKGLEKVIFLECRIFIMELLMVMMKEFGTSQGYIFVER